MEVRPRRMSGGSYGADPLAGKHKLAAIDHGPREVGVPGAHAAAMLDHHEVAPAA